MAFKNFWMKLLLAIFLFLSLEAASGQTRNLTGDRAWLNYVTTSPER